MGKLAGILLPYSNLEKQSHATEKAENITFSKKHHINLSPVAGLLSTAHEDF